MTIVSNLTKHVEKYFSLTFVEVGCCEIRQGPSDAPTGSLALPYIYMSSAVVITSNTGFKKIK
jgi:hypothetical protein